MKNFLLGTLMTSVLFIAFGFVYVKNEPLDSKDDKWVIGPRFYTLQEGVTKEEAREWLENEYIQLYQEFPGFDCHVGELVSSSGWGALNENYKEKGDFVMVYFWDSKERHDHYFPKTGWSDDIKNGIAKHQSTFDQLFGKYFIQDKYQNERYEMFARSK